MTIFALTPERMQARKDETVERLWGVFLTTTPAEERTIKNLRMTIHTAVGVSRNQPDAIAAFSDVSDVAAFLGVERLDLEALNSEPYQELLQNAYAAILNVLRVRLADHQAEIGVDDPAMTTSPELDELERDRAKIANGEPLY